MESNPLQQLQIKVWQWVDELIGEPSIDDATNLRESAFGLVNRAKSLPQRTVSIRRLGGAVTVADQFGIDRQSAGDANLIEQWMNLVIGLIEGPVDERPQLAGSIYKLARKADKSLSVGLDFQQHTAKILYKFELFEQTTDIAHAMLAIPSSYLQDRSLSMVLPEIASNDEIAARLDKAELQRAVDLARLAPQQEPFVQYVRALLTHLEQRG